MRRFTFAIIVLLAAAIPLTAFGQKIGSAETAKAAINVKKVAILPLMFRKGNEVSENKTAIDAYGASLLDAFTKLGIEQIDQAKVNGTWQLSTGQSFDPSRFDLPTPEDLVKFGQDLGVDYVAVSRCNWYVKSILTWKGFQTRANAKVDLWIIDIPKSEFSLKIDGAVTDSREKIPDWKVAVSLLILPITFVSGGPETPHMVRSGQLSVAKALAPWLEKQAPTKIKIGG